jgi:hypothetical protein
MVRICNFPVQQTPTNEFASLPLAREYVAAVRERISSFDAREMVEVLARLDLAYHDFPELVLDCPREELLEGLRSAARNMPDRAAIPLLTYCVAVNPTCSSVSSLFEKIVESDGWRLLPPTLKLLCRSREVLWSLVQPIVHCLRQQGRADIILQLFSEVLEFVKFTKREEASDFGDILVYLLSDRHPLGIDASNLTKAAQSARRRLSRPPFGQNEQESKDKLLAMAEHFRAALSPQRSDPHVNLGWPTGRISFAEFLLQWPCEIDLPVDLDDEAFIREAYRAILLRGPGLVEMDQYLRLLQCGVVSKIWIIEDLLASTELRSLERRLRVIYGGHMITEPDSLGDEEMPVVTWPRRSVG